MKRTTLVIALWAMVVATATAQKEGSEQQLAKEAGTSFDAGDYLKAYPLYSQLVSLHPDNPEYAYRFGACAIYSDPDKSQAIRFLSSATRKEVKDPMAWYYLGKAYHLNYQFKEAVTAYETFVSKADPKLVEKTDARREIETCIYGSTLLSNIKDVNVLSKTETDRTSFFRYMNLEGIGGRIITVPDELRSSYDKKMKYVGVTHFPGNSTVIYFPSYGKDGSTGKDIYMANILPDGKFSTPVKVSGDVNTTYDEEFCFLQSDGKTLYFSSKGHNSMGGYDIFKSVYDPSAGSFGPAINLDFAINTPDDDIFFIADSLNQRAYFASARSSDQAHYHVYNVQVQGVPMQIIYLKGSFNSEIDASQKVARVQVKETSTGRTVMESSSERTDGNYVLYVPKGGQYTMHVRTENSPVIHEAIMEVPSFEKPVALRQQMTLKMVDGREKLIVENYFDVPLEEDIASLAANMLREKSRLDVNATEEDLQPAPQPVAQPELTVERTMENATLAAGFSENVTINGIIADMNREASEIETFVNEADRKYANAYAYAQKKQREADAALRQAEALRKESGNAMTEDEVAKLRESAQMAKQAEDLQREAKAAMNAAEAVQRYRDSEAARATALRENATAIQRASSSGNFDETVAELGKEKQRQVLLREGKATPHSELVAAARNKDNELHESENRIVKYREREKELVAEMKVADQARTTARKKTEREAAEARYVELKNELDDVRRKTIQEAERSRVLGMEVKDANAVAEMFNRVAQDSNLGLSASEQVVLDEYQRNTLSMKLGEMDSRLEALEITDPQTLALITDASMDTENGSIRNSSSASVPALPTKNQQEIKSRSETALARVNTSDPTLAPARRMIMSGTLYETEARIQELESRKTTSGISVEERDELNQLHASRSQMKSELASRPTAPAPAPDALRATYVSVNPTYTEEAQKITNNEGTELERTMEMMELRQRTLQMLVNERRTLADRAMTATDENELRTMATRDQELEAAIGTLERESNDITAYKAAYETENKEIIESGAPVNGKLNDQISLTTNYITVLNALEQQEQQKLAMTTDQQESEAIRMNIGMIRKEQEAANARLAGYEQDRLLTVAASEPAPASTSTYVNTLEDVIEVEENDRQAGAEKLSAKMTEQEIIEKVQADAETIKDIFRQKAESESIFAYETKEFTQMVAERNSEETPVNNLDKIQAVQEEIFLIEAEIENEKSPAKQRKLDRDAEKLYFRKSMMEIGNAPAIQQMTAAEYEEMTAVVEEKRTENTEQIATRAMVRDEINKLVKQAEDEYEQAQVLRKQAGPIVDDIEKNDYYRRAYAKEMLAIELLRQAEGIMDNLDLLTSYDDQELTELRYGNPSKVSTEMVAEANGETPSPNAAETAANSEGTTSTDGAASSSETTAVVTDPAAGTASSAENTSEENRTMEWSDTMREERSVARAEGNNVERVYIPVPTPDNAAATPSGDAGMSPVARADAGSYSEEEAANYYYEFPDVLTKDLFVYTNRPVYSESRPMPVDAEMPKGVYYKVQVGAFRNQIPQNLYDEFAPVSGETLSNGITRYTAGFFLTFENADEVKMSIRRLGYSDAFVVAFRDGKRIPLYEAMGMTEQDYQAAVEREYVYGDGGEAPSARNSSAGTGTTARPAANSGTSGNTAATNTGANGAPLRTDYYKGVPNAAPATQVEATRGLFFTVQVGVYSKPVPASTMQNINPLNSELTANGKIRYTSGIFTDLAGAVNKRTEAREKGINDAFITAYYNGVRISLSEADRLLKENGSSILYQR